MNNLRELIKATEVLDVHGPEDMAVTSLHQDSREVKQNGLFFAVRGTTLDGHQYINAAIDKGAVAVVCETLPEILRDNVTYVVVSDTTLALGRMAAKFFGNPSSQINLVGITGTNGKTTTVTLLHSLFLELGYQTGLISTIRNKINTTEIPATQTTPDIISLNRLLRQMADAGREIRPQLKTLFITGYAEHSVIGNGQLGPGMQVLTKPFAIETLISRVSGLMATTAD
jgi:UDP-N-acetylmuramoyl-L-alanyl-D-glutamate--2,6-diaminopimelate ligase